MRNGGKTITCLIYTLRKAGLSEKQIDDLLKEFLLEGGEE